MSRGEWTFPLQLFLFLIGKGVQEWGGRLLPCRCVHSTTVLPPKERKWKRKRSLSFPEGGEEGGGEGKIGGREKEGSPADPCSAPHSNHFWGRDSPKVFRLDVIDYLNCTGFCLRCFAKVVIFASGLRQSLSLLSFPFHSLLRQFVSPLN